MDESWTVLLIPPHRQQCLFQWPLSPFAASSNLLAISFVAAIFLSKSYGVRYMMAGSNEADNNRSAEEAKDDAMNQEPTKTKPFLSALPGGVPPPLPYIMFHSPAVVLMGVACRAEEEETDTAMSREPNSKAEEEPVDRAEAFHMDQIITSVFRKVGPSENALLFVLCRFMGYMNSSFSWVRSQEDGSNSRCCLTSKHLKFSGPLGRNPEGSTPCTCVTLLSAVWIDGCSFLPDSEAPLYLASLI
jgi:hypothetical protein